MQEKLTIFLSSTLTDLEEPRRQVAKYLSVLPSDLLAMEVFGSDESKPVDFCLQQVRKCNLFVGIYAARYGTVDETTGKSITELEYLEADKLLAAGKLKALLLYLIDANADWPIKNTEQDPAKLAKLIKFKDEVSSKHAVSFFQRADDIPYIVLRDVIRKIGIGTTPQLKPKMKSRILLKKRLDRPVGMEYYGEELANLFFGRNIEIDILQKQIMAHKVSLLIGASGVGKTSLLCAGLMNRLKLMGWPVAIIRPLTAPCENLKRLIWAQLLANALPAELDLPGVFDAVAVAHEGTHVLIIVDQFEDVLTPGKPSAIEELVAGLLSFHRSTYSNVHLLLCYRGDVESELGRIWQVISGSAAGLPRTYLGPLTEYAAENIVSKTLDALGIKIIGHTGQPSSFIDSIIEDIDMESRLNGYIGVYPPFIQMVLAHIFESADSKRRYSVAKYEAAGRSRKVIADYLITQLKYLGNAIEKGKQILISLVGSYGTKKQKTLDELVGESLVTKQELRTILSRLIDARIVRAVNGFYEIAHDFLAKRIMNELVSAEEKEAKKFKDILFSRSAAFDTTRAGLTHTEHLHIYKYRNKILCSQSEVKLLLRSYLAGNGPIAYWARRYPPQTFVDWCLQMATEAPVELARPAYRYILKLGIPLPLEKVANAFSDYKDQHELKNYISRLATRDDIPLLIKLNRKKPELVVQASQDALVSLIRWEDKGYMEEMAKSNNPKTLKTLEQISLRLSKRIPLGVIRRGFNSKSQWERLFFMFGIGVNGTDRDLQTLVNLKDAKLSKKLRDALMKSMTRIALRLGKGAVIRRQLEDANDVVVSKTLEAIDYATSTVHVVELIPLYEKFPSLVSRAVLSGSTRADVPHIKALLKRIELEPAARELVYAACKLRPRGVFAFLFKLFLKCDSRIDFWNSFAVVDIVGDCATRQDLPMLSKIINKNEFWKYYGRDRIPKDTIPVADFENAYFIRRLTAAAFGKVAGRKEFPTLFRMLTHSYWVVSHAALSAIKRHGTEEDINDLLSLALASSAENEAVTEAINAIDEKATIDKE
jgi:hypothetical protein